LVNHVFVYGTLRLGCGANGLMRGAEWLRTCELRDATIYHLGGFPGLKFEDGSSVVGDLYQINDRRMLESLDRYEGYHQDDPERSLYIRREVEVDGERAYTYEYNGTPRQEARIASGDWRQQAG
jgi:gamma-glutamylcyclotransferase (GGCT)/AIG2-like uncharacterized protein YtfP